MTTGTDQTAGQLDEATALCVLEMLNGYAAEERANMETFEAHGERVEAGRSFERSYAAHVLGDRLVAMYRASCGLEEA